MDLAAFGFRTVAPPAGWRWKGQPLTMLTKHLPLPSHCSAVTGFEAEGISVNEAESLPEQRQQHCSQGNSGVLLVFSTLVDTSVIALATVDSAVVSGIL